MAAARRGRPPTGGREKVLQATLELIRERGMAKVTTRAVAERAGVAEGTVFYYFEDRSGLLGAVFERSLEPLHLDALAIDPGNMRATLSAIASAIEVFLTAGLDVLMAAQSDAELRDSLHAHMLNSDYGPHRGVATIGAYLASQQKAGLVRLDIDATVVATMVVSDALLRAAVPKLIGNRKGIEPLDAFIDTLATMLSTSSDAG